MHLRSHTFFDCCLHIIFPMQELHIIYTLEIIIADHCESHVCPALVQTPDLVTVPTQPVKISTVMTTLESFAMQVILYCTNYC